MLSILFYPVLKMEVLLKISVVFIFISIKINLDLKVKSSIDWPSKYLILKLQFLLLWFWFYRKWLQFILLKHPASCCIKFIFSLHKKKVTLKYVIMLVYSLTLFKTSFILLWFLNEENEEPDFNFILLNHFKNSLLFQLLNKFAKFIQRLIFFLF